ncbi:hypothetical protein [Pseudactinotalea sp. Z1748]|uniref:hypothetical protein n=1 Tax=Pseudactinotalea sp. Z1748 TaxID=3413027 RepID=UPI003C79AA4F
MSTHDIPRQPSGQPTGGQFAETSKPSSGLALAGDDSPGTCLQCGGPTEIDSGEVSYHLSEDGEFDYAADADHVALSDNGLQATTVAAHPSWAPEEVDRFVDRGSDWLLDALERFPVDEPEVEYTRYPIVAGEHITETPVHPEDVGGQWAPGDVERLEGEFRQFVEQNSHLIDAAMRQRPKWYGDSPSKFARDFMLSRTAGSEGFAQRNLYQVGTDLHEAASAYPDVRPQFDEEEGLVRIVEVPKSTNPYRPYFGT